MLRYVDVVSAMAILTAGLYLCGGHFIEAFPVHRSINIGAWSVVVAIICSVAPFKTIFHPKKLRYLVLYPSVGFPVFIILGVFAFACLLSGVSLIGAYIAIVVGVALRWVWLLLHSQLSPEKVRSCEFSESEMSIGVPEELGWVFSEKPLNNVSQDRLDYKSLVSRMAELLQSDTYGSFGLTGPHGSGKSSVVRMAKTEIENRNKDCWFVFVAGWGRNMKRLPEHVLGEVVRELGDRGVETYSLSTWPVDYMRELLGTGSWWTRLLGICMHSQYSSSSVLERLDPVLDAIGKKLVIVIEDTDRARAGIGTEGLCHLLDDFRELKNVKFCFLKSEETEMNIDFHRLCDHTEMMPTLSFNGIKDLYLHVSGYCQAQAEQDHLFFPGRFDLNYMIIGHHLWNDNSGQNDIFQEVLITLAHTPRSMKHAFRRVLISWSHLHGEVDFFELLTLTMLRESLPRGYGFIKDNLTSLRGLPESTAGHDDGKINPVKDARKKIEGLALSPPEKLALKVALKIFGFNISIYGEESFYLSKTPLRDRTTGGNIPTPPQSISNKKGTDYFMRMEAGSLGGGELSDQKVIAEVKKYVERRSDELPKSILSSWDWAQKVEQFSMLLPDDALVDLIEDYIRITAKTLRGSWKEHSPGFLMLRDLLRGRSRRLGEMFLSRVERVLLLAVNGSLELAHAVYYWYLRKTEFGNLVRDVWVEQIQENIKKSPSYLVEAMNPEYPYDLYHTMRFRDDYSSFNQASEWQWIVPHILESARLDAARVLPGFAHLLIKDMRAPTNGETMYEFDVGYFNELCPDDSVREAVARVLLEYADKYDERNETAEQIKYVQALLMKYLPERAVRSDDDGETKLEASSTITNLRQ